MNQILLYDFETRSAADLRKTGVVEYARHESTEILCVAFRWGPREQLRDIRTKVWCPHLELPGNGWAWNEFIRALQDSSTILAGHNVLFEAAITMYVLPRYLRKASIKLPEIAPSRWACTAAQAAMMALPRSLEGSAKAMGLDVEKDKEGHRLMMKMAKPRKLSKKNTNPWHDDPADFERLIAYCVKDVEVETEIHLRLPQLPPLERKVFELDITINQRGFAVDQELISAALDIVAEETASMDAETAERTLGLVTSMRERDAALAFLGSDGLDLPNLQAKTVENALKGEIDENPKALLKIRQAISKSSTAKYAAFYRRSRSDGRVRDILKYHGASTGRFCLPGNAEVLTPYGWCPLNEWVGAPIVQWHPENRQLSLDHSPECNTFATTGGELVGIDNRCISIRCTGEHRIPVFTHRHKFRIGTADYFFKKRLDDMPIAGNFFGPFRIPPLHTQIMVMVQADGHFPQSKKSGYGLLFGFKRSRKIKRCVELLKQAGIVFKQYPHTSGNGATRIRVLENDLPDWLKNFKDKKFRGELAHNPNVFMSEVALWDGHRQSGLSSFEYVSVVESNAKFVQTMAHLNGMSSRITSRPAGRGGNTNWSKAYRVFVRPRDTLRVSENNWSKVPFTESAVYCPTTKTGFFLCRQNGFIFVSGNSATGAQIQNLPKGTVKAPMEELVNAVKTKDPNWLRLMYGEPFAALASAIRGVIVASPDHTFYCSDFNAIELRGAFWLADHEAGLEALREGRDLYVELASDIYTINREDVDSDQRFIAKQAQLGCLYGLGWRKFQEYCGKMAKAIPDELANRAVTAFRTKHSPVPKLWKGLEGAAMHATRNRGTKTAYGRTQWIYKEPFLYCRLPSGRCLSYYKAYVSREETPFGERDALYYWGVNPRTRQWEPQKSWGGVLVENCHCQDTFVLVNRGWVKIIDVRPTDKVFDGVEWVNHGGLFCQGEKQVGTWLNIRLTGSHLILAGKKWLSATSLDASTVSESLVLGRALVPWWLRNRVLAKGLAPLASVTAAKSARLTLERLSGSGRRIAGLAGTPLRGRKERKLEATEQLCQTLKFFFRGFTDTLAWCLGVTILVTQRIKTTAHVALPFTGPGWLTENFSFNTPRLSPGGITRPWTWTESTTITDTDREIYGSLHDQLTRETNAIRKWSCIKVRVLRLWNFGKSIAQNGKAIMLRGTILRGAKRQNRLWTSIGEKSLVYDIANCGPRHRYMVMTSAGPVVSHNCVQGLCRDLMVEAMLRIEAAGYPICLTVHDEVLSERIGGNLDEFNSLMKELPPWAAGLPVSVAGWTGPRYQKG